MQISGNGFPFSKALFPGKFPEISLNPYVDIVLCTPWSGRSPGEGRPWCRRTRSAYIQCTMYGPFGLLVLYGPTYVYTYNMGRSGSRPMGAERLTARNFYHGKPVVMPNFPGNFRKGKMPQNALFPKEFPETLVQANFMFTGERGQGGS